MNLTSSGFSFLGDGEGYVCFTEDFIVSLVKVSCARFFSLFPCSDNVPALVFLRFCDAFLLLFIGNMIKQLITQVAVCLFGFASL